MSVTKGTPVPPGSGGAAQLLALINGVLAGVGTLYASTRSVTITLVAGLAAILLGALLLILRR